MPKGNGHGRVRYVVIGGSHISQVAVLPAFDNAENSELVALISGDEEKRRVLGERHSIPHTGDYDDFERVVKEAKADAVYITVPNHLHCEWTLRAAKAGLHVLCEKPMAVTEEECDRMHEACEEAGVKLMVAYRLHFEGANLLAVCKAASENIGSPRYFVSSFSQQVKPGDIRLMPIDKGGGSVYDMGTYCINAARYLFRDEPVECFAVSSHGQDGDDRFQDCDEMTAVTLRFPGGRIATFTSSFGAAHTSSYRVVGTEGDLRMDPAYGYATSLAIEITHEGDTHRQEYPKRDQFAPELIHFSDCILPGREPEPDWREGKADVRIIQGIYASARAGRPVELEPIRQIRRPTLEQAMERPGFDKPDEVHASGPSA